jgi:hypothetical protein
VAEFDHVGQSQLCCMMMVEKTLVTPLSLRWPTTATVGSGDASVSRVSTLMNAANPDRSLFPVKPTRMKFNNSMLGGTLRRHYFPAYAKSPVTRATPPRGMVALGRLPTRALQERAFFALFR